MIKSNKKGIALLITLLFIMLITISVGIGLKQVNEASNHVKAEKFLFQTSVILDDVFRLLQTSKELDNINSKEEFADFLSEASFIPFEHSGIKVSLELSSARSRFNLNSLKNNSVRIEQLKQYVTNYMVNISFVDILLDSMGGIKEDMYYTSDIFYEKPYLFRDYIASDKHFGELSDFYVKNYHDDNLKNIDFEKLFYFSSDKNSSIDLTYATAEVWEMMLGCDKLRATELSAGYYDTFESLALDLSIEELDIVKNKFGATLFEPYVDVIVNIIENNQSAKIKFEYDIKNKKGSNFVYDI